MIKIDLTKIASHKTPILPEKLRKASPESESPRFVEGRLRPLTVAVEPTVETRQAAVALKSAQPAPAAQSFVPRTSLLRRQHAIQHGLGYLAWDDDRAGLGRQNRNRPVAPAVDRRWAESAKRCCGRLDLTC
jgi:hypothetical protein